MLPNLFIRCAAEADFPDMNGFMAQFGKKLGEPGG
jgi:hypothetical protein